MILLVRLDFKKMWVTPGIVRLIGGSQSDISWFIAPPISVEFGIIEKTDSSRHFVELCFSAARKRIFLDKGGEGG